MHRAWVEFPRGAGVLAEVAEGAEDQARGLSGRASLPWGTGMLFVFGEVDDVEFQTGDMRFPIDIVFVERGRVRQVVHDLAPGRRVRGRCDAALEVPAGSCRASGVRAGDRVRVTPLD